MRDIIEYIIKFLIGTKQASQLVNLIGYTRDPKLLENYPIVIYPSKFFDTQFYGTPASIPTCPLNEIEGTPILFGTTQKKKLGTTLVIYADIIASTYFLITRYEEIVQRNTRDSHGRFPGKMSLPVRGGFINRPVIEEYGRLLRQWLRETLDSRHTILEPDSGFSKIWLTHDVDVPFFCRTWRHIIRESIKGIGFKQAWKYYRLPDQQDPYNTFSWILDKEKELKSIHKDDCQTVFFIKAGGKKKEDKPFYNREPQLFRQVIQNCQPANNQIGLHTSYTAGLEPQWIKIEKKLLEKALAQPVFYNRNHFLASREPEDFEELEKAKITDDFTMGYADHCGFRLGTCRPVKWINPSTRRISNLTLHPLICMDVTLSEQKYMNLNETEAIQYIGKLIDPIHRHGGEIVLLWHNDRLREYTTEEKFRHRYVYESIIEKLKSL